MDKGVGMAGSVRVTIMLDAELQKRLHRIQADMIRHDGKGHSFSQVINHVLREALKR